MANIMVTGASRGLGLGITRQLVGEGHQVIAIARKTSPELTELGKGVVFEPFDLGETDAIGPFVRRIRKAHGAIFGLVNNAGIGTPGVLATMPDHDVERLVRINT